MRWWRSSRFLAEKGMQVPVEHIDLASLQHKSAEFTALNPLQRVPVLVLDDGTVITESIAICRYFEGLRPEPPLKSPLTRGFLTDPCPVAGTIAAPAADSH